LENAVFATYQSAVRMENSQNRASGRPQFMAFCGRATSVIHQMLRSAYAVAAAAFLLVVTTLAGCGLSSDGVGSLMVDPARYDGYNCKDLAGQWKGLVEREKQLRNLMDRADEGGGTGEIISALSYRSDYETVLEQKKVLQRTAAEKGCQMGASPVATQAARPMTMPAQAPAATPTTVPVAAPAFTSDQTIR
jgi:hypothetical protein